MTANDALAKIKQLLSSFEADYVENDLRSKVQALIPVFLHVRKLGKIVVEEESDVKLSARDRILFYIRKYPYIIIKEHEIALVAGISEWARRVRELRVQYGWKIISGIAANEIALEDELSEEERVLFSEMKPSDYILIDEKQDRESAYRWSLANDIRKKKISAQDKIIEFLRKNVGKEVSSEELRYVANGKSEWARRVRELRTEQGWPVSTKYTGRPNLPVGIYVLEEDRQTPVHDRKISQKLRAEVLIRDEHTCKECGWNINDWNRSDPRFLEIHHILHHSRGGETKASNLVTLCNICHDERHRLEK